MAVQRQEFSVTAVGTGTVLDRAVTSPNSQQQRHGEGFVEPYREMRFTTLAIPKRDDVKRLFRRDN
jgi:hypothetical protein